MNIQSSQNLKSILYLLFWALGLSLLSIFFLDQPLAQFFAKPELIQFWLWNREITNIALSEHYFILSIFVFFMTSFVLPNISQFRTTKRLEKLKRYKIWSIHFFICLLTSGIVLHIFKNMIGRQRPHKTPDFNPYIFEPLSFHWDLHSMPSGHAQVCFTVAFLFAKLFPNQNKIIYSLAALIAFTRVVTHAHFLSDIIMGAWVGYSTSFVTTYWLDKKTQIGFK